MKELGELTSRGVSKMLDKIRDFWDAVPPCFKYGLVFVAGFLAASVL